MDTRDVARTVRHSGVLMLAALIVVVAGAALPGAAPAGSGGLETTLRGVLALVWGDGPPENPQTRGPVAILTDEGGSSVELLLDDATVQAVGGWRALDRRRVEVRGTVSSVHGQLAAASVVVRALRTIDPPAAPAAITGAQPWVSIMCKFSDISAEPKNLTYFQNMYMNAFPGLDHYWRELSYSNANVSGSTAYGWFTLPQPRSYYIPSGGSANLSQLFDDCTAVADPAVNFTPFVGINLMFNSDLDGFAWGGGRWATLDGVTKLWYTTWEPPWGYNNVSTMAHEMGHGFGLPHSDWLGGTSVYDNSWDVMSNSWAGSGSDPTYGHYAQHTISHHKNLLGWWRAPEIVTVPSGQSISVRLERLGYPGFPIAKMVKVPIGGSATYFYTVEARQKKGYDVQLPGAGTIIHEVDTSRNEDARVQGTDGAMGSAWAPGTLFRDAANNIGVAVVGAPSSASGYIVAVGNNVPLATAFPAIDTHSATGTSSNLNGVLEPGETVLFEPSWTNVSASSIAGVTGSGTSFTGPAGATYSIPDNAASYGTIASGATSSCYGQSNCYQLQVSNPPSRPATHWDATFVESVTGGISRSRTIHIGNSFTDVPPTYWAYKFVETLLHSGLTSGCAAFQYCPENSVTRWEMAVFIATAMAGSGAAVPVSGTIPGYGSFNCTTGGTSVFTDVPPTDGGCKFIHYILTYGITAGCSPNQYCPSQPVTRWQMAVFLSVAMSSRGVLPVSGTVPGLGSFNCVTGGSSVFTDVPPTDGGCRSVHFIATQGVTAGCGPSQYCPSNPVTRAQMAVFLSAAFDFQLYAP
ncbi:MAG TPA: S-layer homology domain-containing protein [Thermoanaerobaculaceae bacterium]|nr:S-layer homology domain-containing protein [Thermoanaerobaculaceae bacterium]HRS16191.1 S-layer homology domain-containing protein [Thermoanaerobaculaceae bacterium]